jgi:transcriptional regulator with XRE-family HTH domain
VTRETLGQRLAQLRREKAARDHRDIDQAEIAKAIGIGAGKQSYVSRWENDIIPRDEVLAKLAGYYGVTLGWLRYGEGEKYADPKTPIIKERERERDITAAHQPGATSKRAVGRGRRDR